MWWIIGGIAAFIVLLAWSAVVVGARADRAMEHWLEGKRDREG
jgi:hypothetical protein